MNAYGSARCQGTGQSARQLLRIHRHPTGLRLPPINDEAHVRNALARFNRVSFDDEESRDRARTRLLKAAKRYGLMPVGFIDGELRPERRLPTGRVSLLLADVEDSTGHLTDLGDRYERLLADVRRLLRTATRRAGGYEVDARGDEFFAAFVEPGEGAGRRSRHAAGLRIPCVDERSQRAGPDRPAGSACATPDGHRVRRNRGQHGCPHRGHGTHGAQILASWSLREAISDADRVAWREGPAIGCAASRMSTSSFRCRLPDLATDFPPLSSAALSVGWATVDLVGARGLEPPTSSSRTTRATYCATPRPKDGHPSRRTTEGPTLAAGDGQPKSRRNRGDR